MKSEYINSDDERNYYKMTEELTDQEIQAKQAYYLRCIKNDTHRIMNNVVFIFWVLTISFALSIIFWLTAINSVPRV